MNMKQTLCEQVSALADGELSVDQVAELLRKAPHNEVLESWDVYHAIGDMLRSDDIAGNLSEDFSAKFAARFEQEPAIVAPAAAAAVAARMNTMETSVANPRRWVFPGVAAAVAIVITSLTISQMTTVNQGAQAVANADKSPALSVELNEAGVEVLRDPGIHDYLLAHQQFSPSLYNSAHYVRSATFASDSSK